MDLSVIIPFFKAESTIQEAVNSVLSQSVIEQRPGLQFEIIIINDDPNAQQSIVLKGLCESDSRIKVRNNTGMCGASAARNLGIAAAAGRLVAFLDADDVWLPFHLEKHLQLHDIYHPALTSSEYSEVDQGLNVINERVMRSMPHRRNSALKDSFNLNSDFYIKDARELFLNCCPALTSAVVVKRESIIAVGGFSLTLQTAEDVHAWILMAGLGQGFAFSPVASMLYRQGNSTLSKSRMSDRWRDLAVQYESLSGSSGYSGFMKEIKDHSFGYFMLYLAALRAESRYREAFAVVLHVSTRYSISVPLIREALSAVLRRR